VQEHTRLWLEKSPIWQICCIIISSYLSLTVAHLVNPCFTYQRRFPREIREVYTCNSCVKVTFLKFADKNRIYYATEDNVRWAHKIMHLDFLSRNIKDIFLPPFPLSRRHAVFAASASMLGKRLKNRGRERGRERERTEKRMHVSRIITCDDVVVTCGWWLTWCVLPVTRLFFFWKFSMTVCMSPFSPPSTGNSDICNRRFRQEQHECVKTLQLISFVKEKKEH